MAGNRDRQRQRARERYELQRAKRQARRRKIRQRSMITLAVVLVAGLATGLTVAFTGSSPKPKAAAKATPTASATASASATPSASTIAEPATHCTYTKSSSGTVKSVSLPPASPDYKATYTATINTNLGPIVINLLNSKATCAVNSFVHLAEANFWNDTQCHRVSDSGGLYMLQCGDPTAKASENLSCSSSTLGTGTPGYVFGNENLPSGTTLNAGTVAMANTGTADSNGSQFFLVFQKTTLDPATYSQFGTITSGLDILQDVGKAGTSCTYSAGGGVPKKKVVIDSVTIKQS